MPRPCPKRSFGLFKVLEGVKGELLSRSFLLRGSGQSPAFLTVLCNNSVNVVDFMGEMLYNGKGKQ